MAAAAAGPAPAAASAPPPSWGPRSRRGSELGASTPNAVTVPRPQRANRGSIVGGATPPSGPRPHPAPPPPPPRRRGPAARGEATRRGRANGGGALCRPRCAPLCGRRLGRVLKGPSPPALGFVGVSREDGCGHSPKAWDLRDLGLVLPLSYLWRPRVTR